MYDFADTVVADRYVLEREVGRGGMATVWLARDLDHDRPVAVKILRHELAGAIGVDRFIREVRLTARLQHPNIIPILDSGVLTAPDGASLPWYAMSYLDGESLRDRLHREPQVPIDEALRITQAVGSALHAAHQHGIIHRDIKPENVFLTGEHVYVVDFGIAKALLDTGVNPLTSTGIAVGTPAYMSPEQGLAGQVDARTDQYSLATILYEMLAGETPFTGKNSQAVIARRVAEPARSFRAVRSTVPPVVERAVLKALERAPADRFRDVNAFLAALAGETPSAAEFFNRRVFGRSVAVAALLAAAATAVWLFTSRPRGRGAHVVDSTSLALYQRGLRAYERRTPGAVVEAIKDFNAAIVSDSSNALAWNALAKAYVRAEERGFAVPGLTPDSMLSRAVSAVDRALQLNSRSADAWITHAIVSQRIDPTDWGPGLRSLRQAMNLDSTMAPAWHLRARSLAETGDMDAAVDAWRRCVRLNPSYSQGVAFLALAHYWRQEYDSAARWADSAIALDPNYLLGRSTAGFIAIERGDFERAKAAFAAHRRLSSDIEMVNSIALIALAQARSGRRDEARSMMKQADSLAVAYKPTPLHTAVDMAQSYAALGEPDRAMAWLGRYATPRDLHFQLHLRCDPPFAALAGDARFRSLLLPIASKSGSPCGARSK